MSIPEVYLRARSWKSMFPLPVTDFLKLLGQGYSHQPIPKYKRSIANEILNPYRTEEHSPYVQKMLDAGVEGEEKTIEQLKANYAHIFPDIWSPPNTPGEFRKWRLRGDPGFGFGFGSYINGTPDFLYNNGELVGEIKTPTSVFSGPEWKKDTHIYIEKDNLYFKKYWCQVFLYNLLLQEQLGKLGGRPSSDNTHSFEYSLVFNVYETELHVIEYKHTVTWAELNDLWVCFYSLLGHAEPIGTLVSLLDTLYDRLPTPTLSILPFI